MSNIKIQLSEPVGGLKTAIESMRNAHNSWDRSDSKFVDGVFQIGEADMDLAKRLIISGNEHRKYLRMIQVWLNVTAPRYIWTEIDTYKVGTTRNSSSTMHKLFEEGKEFTLENFAMHNNVDNALVEAIKSLNRLQKEYLECKAQKDFKGCKTILREAKIILPEGYLLYSTINLNYEVLRSMCHQRKKHRLTEWQDFCKWVEENLPYAKELILE